MMTGRLASTSTLRSTMHPVSPELRVLVAGFVWAAVSVTIFAGWFVVTRFSVTHALRVWDVIALRFGGGTLLLGPLLMSRTHRVPCNAYLPGLLLALLWGAPFVLFVALGLQLTSAAEASAITPALMPVFAGLLAWAVLREAPGRVRLFGYLAIVVGLVAMVASNAIAHGPINRVGIIALIIAAVMWAVYTLRFRGSGLTSLQAAGLICTWSALLYLPAYAALGLSHLGDASAEELAFQIIYQGGLMSCVGIVTFNRAVALLGSGAAAAIIALLPVIATTLALPVLGEIPTWSEGLAIAVIAVGVLLAARPTQSRTSR